MPITQTETIFVAARAAIVVLCLLSLLLVGRQAWVGGQPRRSLWPTLFCAGGLLLAAALLTANDLYAALAPGEQLATYGGAWLWLVFDAGVPLLMIQVLRLMRQRDEAFAALERLSVTDALTELANRRGFEQAAASALLQARRHSEPTSLILFDLDRFKAINDGYGHAAGDAVLRGVAAALRRQVRATDVAARLGGEEFALLCPGTTLEQAAALAERVRAEIRDAVPHPAGSDTLVTSSAGVAPVQWESGLEPALNTADRALYAAKAAGRDRVVVAPG
ncbi:GGDEF domain-containing protein [Roseomonas terrae]|uniref:diguanylate cyclase n=1 Tax=Neoroseomonas terrae TaxID=424799 RepID=A0ABS5EL43_9PROT|nr:GGDEF domain-containing protein [Neoroseomonas terrae]MBR0651744.1 GGDEF domain-containing protein [Neoroseomonas terrae]